MTNLMNFLKSKKKSEADSSAIDLTYDIQSIFASVVKQASYKAFKLFMDGNWIFGCNPLMCRPHNVQSTSKMVIK